MQRFCPVKVKAGARGKLLAAGGANSLTVEVGLVTVGHRTAGMAGFSPLPQRGDGYSLGKAREVLRTDSKFKYTTPRDFAEEARKENIDRWLGQLKYRDTLTEEMLFCAPRKMDQHSFSGKHAVGPEIRGECWICGYWGVRLVDEGKRKFDWQIDCLVGEVSCVAPPVIRKKIVEDLGEAAYERFKARQWDDLPSLQRCLNEACQYLQKHNSIALSWVTSPSSARLLEKLEIRMEKEWAFLFGHYRF